MSYNAIGVANGDGSVTLYANSSGSGGGSSSNINAVYEETTALAAHSTGTYIYLNNLVYLVTNNIAIGDTITPGTNVSLVTGKGSDTEVYVADLPGEGGGGGGSSTAADVSYDNTDSGLTADNVQDAIDEMLTNEVGSMLTLTNEEDFVAPSNGYLVLSTSSGTSWNGFIQVKYKSGQNYYYYNLTFVNANSNFSSWYGSAFALKGLTYRYVGTDSCVCRFLPTSV